ncbi:MAG: hypothetical protein OJF52_003257 [Nitrospira sp.]|nr:MAG: hypothetical protein OJF52_003257 [Nitrospira sp.]
MTIGRPESAESAKTGVFADLDGEGRPHRTWRWRIIPQWRSGR